MSGSAQRNAQNPILIAFGKRIVELRAEKGMTQEDLAGKTEFDRTYISGIENAKRNVTLTAVFKLADALGIEAKQLLDISVEK